MALGTENFGRGNNDIESTDNAPGAGIERTREFIASPTHNSDGTVTHSADAVLGYEPEQLLPVTVPATDGTPIQPDVVPATTPPPAETSDSTGEATPLT